MIKAKITLATAAFLGVAGLTSISVAATTVTYPGIECVEANDTTPELLNDNGKTFNDHDIYNAELECPLPYLDSNLGGSISAIHVRVDDSHPAESVSCYAAACTWDGTSCLTTPVKNSGNGFQSLYLGSTNAWTNGYAYISCAVPDKENGNRSGILSYRVNS